MISRRIVRALAVTVLLASAATGCASFRRGDVPATTPWPPAPSASKKSVSLLLANGTTNMNGKAADAPPAMVAKWRELTKTAYSDSGLFSAVVPENTPSDIRAEVRINDEGTFSPVLSFLSGFTLTLLPSSATDRISMHTDFKNADGDVLATIEKSESMTMWTQFFLVFVMPFNWPGTVANDTFRDLSRATLAEAHAKGVL
jgi:hypothetical protein